jgi:hypothetical protein
MGPPLTVVHDLRVAKGARCAELAIIAPIVEQLPSLLLGERLVVDRGLRLVLGVGYRVFRFCKFQCGCGVFERVGSFHNFVGLTSGDAGVVLPRFRGHQPKPEMG